MKLAIIIPARNEEATVGPVAASAVAAAIALGGTVLVVADNCSDATADRARAAGARVIERHTESSSKAAAVVAGILSTRAEVTCLIDADCVGITPEAIYDMVAPVLDGRALMSTLTFDYGPYSWLVECLPWSTGQRAFRTDLLRLDDPRLDGYNLEILLNEAVGARRGVTVSRFQRGLHHRTKLAKAGIVAGVLANRAMWTSIAGWARSVDRAAYRRYVRGVVVDYDGEWLSPPRPVVELGLAALVLAGAALSRSRPPS